MEHIEGLGRFKYLGILMDRSYNDQLAVLHNIRKESQVRGRLWKLPQREWAKPTVSEKFYRAVVQVVLLFGAEIWVLT